MNGGIDFQFWTFMMEVMGRAMFQCILEMFPPSYSPVGWFSPLNSINFHFPNLISWIFSISLSPPALRIIPRDDILQCCSRAIGEIITNGFCRQNMAFRRKGILFYLESYFYFWNKFHSNNIHQLYFSHLVGFKVCFLHFIVRWNN